MLNVTFRRLAFAGSLAHALSPRRYAVRVSFRSRMSWTLATLLLLVAGGAAQAGNNDIVISMSNAQTTQQRFHIPSGSMIGALSRFESQSGLRLIYDSKVTEHAYTVGVEGRYAPMLALEMLLTCTGVNYHFITDNTVILNRFVAPPPIHLSRDASSAQ